MSVKDLSPHTIGAEVLGRAERAAHHAVDLAERAADSLPSMSLPSVSLPSVSLPSVSLPHRHTRPSRWRWVAIGGVVAAVIVAVSMLLRHRREADARATDAR